ncbi:MAG TPA: hypothetical protein VGF84_10710 [Micromonosporaceae bacterium]|jgi:hypothetical protein
MTNGDWVTSSIAVLALVVSVAALVIAIRSTKHAPAVATAPAEATITPAEDVHIPLEGVAWSITHEAGISWRLNNVGTEPAYDVNAAGLPAESAGLVRVANSFVDVPNGGSLGFHVVRTAHHPNVTGLAVTWSGQDTPVIVAMP